MSDRRPWRGCRAKNIAGVKDATASLVRGLAATRLASATTSAVLGRETRPCSGYMAHGGHRLHLGGVECRHPACSRISRGLAEGRSRHRSEVARQANAAAHQSFHRFNLSPVKYALSLLGKIDDLRLPMVPVSSFRRGGAPWCTEGDY